MDRTPPPPPPFEKLRDINRQLLAREGNSFSDLSLRLSLKVFSKGNKTALKVLLLFNSVSTCLPFPSQLVVKFPPSPFVFINCAFSYLPRVSEKRNSTFYGQMLNDCWKSPQFLTKSLSSASSPSSQLTFHCYHPL